MSWNKRFLVSESDFDYIENTSYVTVTFQICRTDGNMYGWSNTGNAYWYINLSYPWGGSTWTESSGNQYFTFNWNNTPANTWWTVGAYKFKVWHNNTGNQTIKLDAYYNTGGISPASFSCTQSNIELDTIPRYVKITDFKCDSVTPISASFSFENDAACSKLWYRINNGAWVELSPINSFVVSGLKPGTEYDIDFCARRADSSLDTYVYNVLFATTPITTIVDTTTECDIGGSISLSFAHYDTYDNSSILKLYQKNPNGEYIEIASIQDIEIIPETETGLGKYEWDISEYSNDMYSNTPNSNKSDIKVVCGTTINEIEYTSEVLGSANVVDSNPDFADFEHGDTNSDIALVTGSSSNMLQYRGNMKLVLGMDKKAIAKNASTIHHYDVVLTKDELSNTYQLLEANEEVVMEFGAFSNTGQYTISVTAFDSRNNQSDTITKTFNVYRYHSPIINVQIDRLNNFDSQLSILIRATVSKITIDNAIKNKLDFLSLLYNDGRGQDIAIPIDNCTILYNDIDDDYIITYTNPNWNNVPSNEERKYVIYVADSIVSKENSYEKVEVKQGIPIFNIVQNGHVIVNDLPNLDNLENECSLIVGSDIVGKTGEGTELKQRKVFESIDSLFIFSPTEPVNQPVGSFWIETSEPIILSSE